MTNAPSDVIILVMPLSSDQADIALVYQNPLPAEKVRHDIDRLVKACGGKLLTGAKIETKSLQPNNLTRFPLRTGANFTLLHSPQVHDSAPVLEPYLTAFQAWNHVEVMFWLPELNPYHGVTQFESDALTVQMIKDPGVYRYEVEIREHDKPLPALTVDQASSNIKRSTDGSNVNNGNVVQTDKSPSHSLPLILFLAGCALTGGGCVYLAVSRRSPIRVSPSTRR